VGEGEFVGVSTPPITRERSSSAAQ